MKNFKANKLPVDQEVSSYIIFVSWCSHSQWRDSWGTNLTFHLVPKTNGMIDNRRVMHLTLPESFIPQLHKTFVHFSETSGNVNTMKYGFPMFQRLIGGFHSLSLFCKTNSNAAILKIRKLFRPDIFFQKNYRRKWTSRETHESAIILANSLGARR